MILARQCLQLSFDVDGFPRQAGGDQRRREFGARYAGKFEQTAFVLRQMIDLMGDHLYEIGWHATLGNRDQGRQAPRAIDFNDC